MLGPLVPNSGYTLEVAGRAKQKEKWNAKYRTDEHRWRERGTDCQLCTYQRKKWTPILMSREWL